MAADIKTFLAAQSFAVVGTSADRSKYGNKVLRCYMQHQKVVTPVHPREKNIEGLVCVASLAELGPEVTSLSIITPPKVTTNLVREAIVQGKIRNIWMQPGAESEEALALAETAKLNLISGGPCLLLVLGYSETP